MDVPIQPSVPPTPPSAQSPAPAPKPSKWARVGWGLVSVALTLLTGYAANRTGAWPGGKKD